MWRNFRFLLICHVQKFEISPHDSFFLHGHRPCVRDKYQVCSVEEDRLLRHKTKLGSKLGHIERLNVVSLDGEAALVEIIEALDELDDSGLAAP